MKSARFLVVALLLVLWGVDGCASSAHRQRPGKALSVSGYVLDAVSRQPVSGVWVHDSWMSEEMYARTDSSGHFVIHLPVVPGEIVRQLVVETLLYQGQATITVDKASAATAQHVVILLRRNAYRFRPYGCQQLADSARIFPYAAASIEVLSGFQYGFLIRDTTIYQPRKLRTVSFRVGHNAFPRVPFRIRIYRYKDHLKEPPGEDLLLENIMVCSVKEGVITYYVSSYDIMVAGTGFYLALEPVLGSNKFYCADSTVAYTPTGPILRPPCARADIRTWEYTIGKGWHRATAVENCWPFYESALSVEVEPAPKPPAGR